MVKKARLAALRVALLDCQLRNAIFVMVANSLRFIRNDRSHLFSKSFRPNSNPASVVCSNRPRGRNSPSIKWVAVACPTVSVFGVDNVFY